MKFQLFQVQKRTGQWLISIWHKLIDIKQLHLQTLLLAVQVDNSFKNNLAVKMFMDFDTISFLGIYPTKTNLKIQKNLYIKI